MKASGNNPDVFFIYGCFRKIIKEESPCTAMPIRYLAARTVRVLRQSWPFARLVLQAGLQLRRKRRSILAGTGHPGTGSVQMGWKVWMLARMPQRYIIAGDEIAPYLVIMNSHDGSSGVKVAMAPIRVVCQNTLTISSTILLPGPRLPLCIC